MPTLGGNPTNPHPLTAFSRQRRSDRDRSPALARAWRAPHYASQPQPHRKPYPTGWLAYRNNAQTGTPAGIADPGTIFASPPCNIVW